MNTRRILDATSTECILSARAPVDISAMAAIAESLPLPTLKAAVPVLPHGSYGADVIAPLVARGDVIEPLTWDAHAQLVARADLPEGRIVVDPTGVALGDPAPEGPAPDGWIREHVVWLDTRPPTKAALLQALDALPDDARLRLRDPHGALRPATIDTVLRLADAHRITLVLEDAAGLAVATALRALEPESGPLVRSSLLGLGPRTGHPRTELLLPHGEATALRPAAERAALIAGLPMPTEHPLWGARHDEAAEPERIRDGLPVRWNPATLPALVSKQAAELGLALDDAQRQEIVTLLAARLRPGEALDGPLLYAFLATHLDLARHARDAEARR